MGSPGGELLYEADIWKLGNCSSEEELGARSTQAFSTAEWLPRRLNERKNQGNTSAILHKLVELVTSDLDNLSKLCYH